MTGQSGDQQVQAITQAMLEVARGLRGQLGQRKVALFAVYGALGCVLGALLGELLFVRTAKPKDVCLVIDASGSMSGAKLAEVKQAATNYARRQELGSTQMAVVGFGSRARTWHPFTHDARAIQAAIETLDDGGSTAMGAALRQALQEFPSGERGTVVASADAAVPCLLLFTDGQPDDPWDTMAASTACRNAGIQIVAIATGDAPLDFLAELTGDKSLVFSVASGDFDEGFRQAERAIGSLAESGGSGQTGWFSLLTTAAWSALLAVGVAVALTHGQNRYLGKPGIVVSECARAALGGIVAGGLAGVTAQLCFFGLLSGLTSMPASGLTPVIAGISRLIGWTVLGSLVARGLAFFVPNLEPSRAWIGGAAGGAVAAMAFLVVTFTGDQPGRLLGAAILGALIGVMIAVVESTARAAWLEIERGRERVTVNLGADPVRVGSHGSHCTVFARGVRPIAASYRFAEGTVRLLDHATEIERVVPEDDSRQYGDVKITVRTARSAAAAWPRSPVVPPPPPTPAPTTGPSATMAGNSVPTAGTGLAGGGTAPLPKPMPSVGRPPSAPPPPPPPPRRA